MSIQDLIKLSDGILAVAVMLYIGARIEHQMENQWEDLMELIDKLTNGKPKV